MTTSSAHAMLDRYRLSIRSGEQHWDSVRVTSSVKDRPSRTEGREEKRREKDKEWFGITTISHCSAKWKTMVSLIAVSSFVFG